ncbi:MAG: L-threonine 3-dehydrogenase [Terracidiphilus sp.]|nr:L-threonine 3-dehydrogenase [Terracidiphilus sp.]MDR3775426.1 L-threonine 3-dehydrogenase [Terracidiphilus sp.]
MSTTMQAVVKAHAAPGIELREVPVPTPGPDEVLVRVQSASVCGTDLHIFNWDPWAQGRIHPPLIPGHEFSGAVAAVGRGVTTVKEGDLVSAEMHVACGKCLQCRTGQAHICQHVRILGVDANGAFASYAIIPETNIWKLSPTIPHDYASLLDPLGNAVHTVLAGDIAAKTVVVSGCGAIGLFSIAVAKACGAARVFALEVNAHRRGVAAAMGADLALDPAVDNVKEQILETTGGTGVDVLLEMSGHPAAMRLGFELLRTGGRASLLGIPSRPVELDFAKDIIFKGATVQGINGRKMFETWFQMEALLATGKLNLEPVITHRLKLSEFTQAMELLRTGEAIKVILKPE